MVVFGYGNPNAQVLVVGEAPGKNEDMEGVPFVGEAGQLLDKYLASVSVNPRLIEMSVKGPFNAAEARELLLTNTFYTNVVACRPPENRDPARDEIAACRTRLLEIIYTVDPVIIFAVGRVSLEALLGKAAQITRDRGEVFDITIPARTLPGLPARKVTYPCLALLHPAFLMRVNDFNQEDGMSDKTYYDVLKGMHIVDEYNWQHYGIPKPKDRPSQEKRKR
jgi:uracil-DNA glycosylase family 4